MSLTPRERAIRKRLRDDFQRYATKCLKIRTKDPRGGPQPFVLNHAQEYLHSRFEAQRAADRQGSGSRAQGRQQGISTYIGGRFYWRTTHSKGVRCFILTMSRMRPTTCSAWSSGITSIALHW
jgi:hypothetical protein